MAELSNSLICVSMIYLQLKKNEMHGCIVVELTNVVKQHLRDETRFVSWPKKDARGCRQPKVSRNSREMQMR